MEGLEPPHTYEPRIYKQLCQFAYRAIKWRNAAWCNHQAPSQYLLLQFGADSELHCRASEHSDLLKCTES